MRYIDGPTTEAQAIIDAPAEIVWALITDINLPAKFSSEFQGADWIDAKTHATPAVGATFTGRNHHVAIGGWQTTCTVTRYVEHEVFEWCVGEPEYPSAKWRFTLQSSAEGVTLTQWM
jgi:Polyketide cyclase / dehydrase and lipid transport